MMVRCIVCNDIVEYDTTWTRTTYTTCTKCRLPVEKSERIGIMSNLPGTIKFTSLGIVKWNHCRKGIIEGKVVNEDDVWVWIELINSVNIGHGDPMVGTGFRDVIAQPSETIQIRKSILTVIESEGGH